MKWSLVFSLLVILVVLIGCTPTPSAPTLTTSETSTPTTPVTTTPAATESLTTTPPPTTTSPTTSTPPTASFDTTPPSPITGLIANNAYDGRVNLWWDRTTAEDFDYYNIYLDEAEIADVTGITAIQQIQDIAACSYQATELEDGTSYYLAVTAVDKSGNEDTQVTSVNATPSAMPGGTAAPDIAVDVYQPDKAWAGTTLLPDNHNSDRPRIIEVNMLGEIVWEYVVPSALKEFNNPGFDVELLQNGNILYVLPCNGVYEIDRSGKVVWQYLTSKISHDADRLPNGNTIFVFGSNDQKTDAQVTEVNPDGDVVWSWYAKDSFDISPYSSISNQGWTHTNAVTRLSNGNTLISPRNFNIVVEVDLDGEVVGTYGQDVFIDQHDPEMLANGNILLANHGQPQKAIEFDLETGKVVWQFSVPAQLLRDADRLPNGNTLITGSTKLIEVTPDGEIVWQLVLKDITLAGDDAARLGFYKADRVSAQG